MQGVSFGYHLFMQLLARTDTDNLLATTGSDSLGDVGDSIAGNLRDENFPAPHMRQCIEHQTHALLQGDVKAGHAGIGDGKYTFVALFQEKGNHAPAAAHDVPVAHHRKDNIPLPLEIVGGSKQFIRAQLGSTIQVNRCRRLVGTESDHLLHSLLDRRLDDILRPHDVCLNRLEGVILARRNLLQRRRVNDNIDSLHRPHQALFVAHIADEIAHLRVLRRRENLTHFKLFQFIARENHHPPDARIARQNRFHKLFPERTGAAGYQN